MVEPQSSKLMVRVRFPSSPPMPRRAASGGAAGHSCGCRRNRSRLRAGPTPRGSARRRSRRVERRGTIPVIPCHRLAHFDSPSSRPSRHPRHRLTVLAPVLSSPPPPHALRAILIPHDPAGIDIASRVWDVPDGSSPSCGEGVRDGQERREGVVPAPCQNASAAARVRPRRAMDDRRRRRRLLPRVRQSARTRG